MRRAVVLLAAAPLALAACGGSSKSSQVKLSPTAYVEQAAKKSAGAPSEHMTLSANATLGGNKIVVTGDGAFDNPRKQGDLKVTADVAGLNVPIEVVLDKTDLYLKTALLQASLPPGKTWAKIDLQKAAASKGIDFSSVLGQDPAQQFQQLQAAGKVTDVGADTIDGAAVEHYRVTVAASQPPEDVWIGKDDGYVHRVRASFTSQGSSVSTQVNFSDFGKSVDVTVPSASETADATNQSLKGLGG